jgi:predicted ArsR family transcriptional regulator
MAPTIGTGAAAITVASRIFKLLKDGPMSIGQITVESNLMPEAVEQAIEELKTRGVVEVRQDHSEYQDEDRDLVYGLAASFH